MSALAIIIIVVVVVAILAAVFVFLPQMRVKRREMELGQRRKQAISEQHTEADRRVRQAEEAEQRARIAQQEAQAERTQAQLHQERAALHEQGMADHELIEDHERERFAGTSAVPAGTEASEDGEATTVAENTGSRGSELDASSE
jgi:FtsZ-interacting cell division protein ZipA